MASWWKKTLLAVAGLAGVSGGAYYLVTRRPVPKKKGKVNFTGLHETVEIITDRYGVPHIYAQNEDDLYFAQGYMHAQERLWQMEFNRRIGSGRLSEIFGEIAIEADRFSRRIGMHRAAAEDVSRISEHSKRILDAYAHGVNASIKRQKRKLPLEFTLLRCKPTPWTVEDSILWAKMMGWNLGGNWETEIIRAHLVAKLGAERAALLETGYDPRHPLIIPPGVEYQGINLGLLEQYEQLKQLSGFGMLGASNNWVVDGTMTVTGSPILCNDPHLGQAAPSIWYECHLVAGDIDVVGVSFPAHLASSSAITNISHGASPTPSPMWKTSISRNSIRTIHISTNIRANGKRHRSFAKKFTSRAKKNPWLKRCASPGMALS